MTYAADPAHFCPTCGTFLLAGNHATKPEPCPMCGGDDDTARLLALIDRGMTQHEASTALWSDDAPLHRQLVVERAGAEAREFVRASLYALVPWLQPITEGVPR